MCNVAHSYDELENLDFLKASGAPKDFFVVAVSDGMGTANDKLLQELFPQLVARLPSDSCHVAYFFLLEECRRFRTAQGLKSVQSPFLFISDENPYPGTKVASRAVIRLAGLQNPDDVRRVIALICEQAYDDDFVKKTKSGEIMRRIERTLGRYGGPLKDCLSLVGFSQESE